MKILKEFQDFAIKGNVVDMAIGIIIGWAFGKVVSSLVADVIMPPIWALVGWVDFTNIKILLSAPLLDEAGAVLKEAVFLNVGLFAQNVFDFTIVAFAMFMVIKMMNKLKKKEEKKEEKPVVVVSKEEQLLTEIRDLLKKTKN